MIIGTSYFENLESAINHYKGYSPSSSYEEIKKWVKRKLYNEEIHIGKPALKNNEILYLDESEWRYFINTNK